MSKQSGDKGEAKKDAKKDDKKKDGKRRIVLQVPPGSPLDTMSEDEIAKQVQDLVGKAGISSRHVGGRVEELLIEIADSSSPTTLSPQGWAARWSRRCAV
jgi:hypothetical protein